MTSINQTPLSRCIGLFDGGTTVRYQLVRAQVEFQVSKCELLLTKLAILYNKFWFSVCFYFVQRCRRHTICRLNPVKHFCHFKRVCPQYWRQQGLLVLVRLSNGLFPSRRLAYPGRTPYEITESFEEWGLEDCLWLISYEGAYTIIRGDGSNSDKFLRWLCLIVWTGWGVLVLTVTQGNWELCVSQVKNKWFIINH